MSTSVLSPLHTSLPQSRRTEPASPIIASPLKRRTMTITQTYYLAHKARAKLSSEAARPDHNLRLLVGHANLLDSLMLDLADAEREQESWFNQSVRGATKSTSEERHVQWADSIVEDPEEDWQAEDADSDSSSDSDSEFDEEDVEMADTVPAVARISMPTQHMEEEDDDFEDDDEDYPHLALMRTHSHSAQLPELDHDSDSSEDESMPPSPPTATIESFSEKEQTEVATTGYKKSFYDEGFYLPPRNPARLVTAISVY